LNKTAPFQLITLGVFFALVVCNLVQEGMFFDGITYSAIARNLAQGNGNILNWNLVYTNTLLTPFHEHPPLAIIIQSFFFQLFGDYLFVERIYSFLTSVLTAILIFKIWNLLFKENETLKKLSWFPVLLWIITPIVFWSYSNNMLENTMTIFDLAAIYLIYKSLCENKNNLLRLSLSGIMILFAFLSKGPAGLFPIIIPVLGFFILKNVTFKKAVIQTVIMFSASSLVLGIYLILNKDAFYVLLNYLNEQVLSSIEGNREINVGNRFYIIQRLLMELIPASILCFSLYFYSKVKKRKIEFHKKNNLLALFFLAIGAAGSIPIAISVKQSGFYLVPSIPLFAISFGIFTVPYLNLIVSQINFNLAYSKHIKIISIIIFFSSVIFTISKIGKIGKNENLIGDIKKIGFVVAENTTISIYPANFEDWSLHAYMIRYFKISLDKKSEHLYYLISKNSYDPILARYSKLNLNTKIYDLYKIK
jgi:4-amino-4-deoxy-L-arabinose transferase-like glycosyltransferase